MTHSCPKDFISDRKIIWRKKLELIEKKFDHYTYNVRTITANFLFQLDLAPKIAWAHVYPYLRSFYAKMCFGENITY